MGNLDEKKKGDKAPKRMRRDVEEDEEDDLAEEDVEEGEMADTDVLEIRMGKAGRKNKHMQRKMWRRVRWQTLMCWRSEWARLAGRTNKSRRIVKPRRAAKGRRKEKERKRRSVRQRRRGSKDKRRRNKPRERRGERRRRTRKPRRPPERVAADP